jgi:hypothetical protein
MVMSEYVMPDVIQLKCELDKNKKNLPTVKNDLFAFLYVHMSRKSPIKQHNILLNYYHLIVICLLKFYMRKKNRNNSQALKME